MFYTPTSSGYLLRVRLSPNSSMVKTLGTTQNADGETYLKISVTVVAEKGKANQELIAYLAKRLRLPKSALTLVSGATDRWKKININCAEPDFERKLQEFIKEA